VPYDSPRQDPQKTVIPFFPRLRSARFPLSRDPYFAYICFFDRTPPAEVLPSKIDPPIPNQTLQKARASSEIGLKPTFLGSMTCSRYPSPARIAFWSTLEFNSPLSFIRLESLPPPLVTCFFPLSISNSSFSKRAHAVSSCLFFPWSSLVCRSLPRHFFERSFLESFRPLKTGFLSARSLIPRRRETSPPCAFPWSRAATSPFPLLMPVFPFFAYSALIAPSCDSPFHSSPLGESTRQRPFPCANHLRRRRFFTYARLLLPDSPGSPPPFDNQIPCRRYYGLVFDTGIKYCYCFRRTLSFPLITFTLYNMTPFPAAGLQAPQHDHWSRPPIDSSEALPLLPLFHSSVSVMRQIPRTNEPANKGISSSLNPVPPSGYSSPKSQVYAAFMPAVRGCMWEAVSFGGLPPIPPSTPAPGAPCRHPSMMSESSKRLKCGKRVMRTSDTTFRDPPPPSAQFHSGCRVEGLFSQRSLRAVESPAPLLFHDSFF